MISHVMRKEILENLLSLRFLLSLLLIVSLFAASAFMFIGKYQQESDDYWKETNKNLSALKEHSKHLYELAFYKQVTWRQPKPLSLCVEGFEKTLPDWFRFDPFTIDSPEVRSRSNFLLTYFSDIDWVFMISLVLSFVALLLTYDCVCGEKEAGTLRLMLAGAIPRYKILLGKYLGVMFTLGIPLLIGLLISLIIVITSNITGISGLDWLKILVIVILSFIYLSVFVLLGIFISSRSHQPASSMAVLLLVWVGLVILIPSFGRIISNTFGKIPTRIEWQKKITEATDQIYRDMQAGKFGKGAGSWNSYEDNPPAAAKYYQALVATKNGAKDKRFNQMIGQANAGRYFTCISPAIIYQRASETIVGTGISRVANIYQQIKKYQENLREYIRSQDAEDSDSLHLLFQFPDEWVAKNWGAISKKPVDFDSVPKFQEKDLALGKSLLLAIWDIGLLALFN
ncbi:MAG: ABC transporter permease subunit, partial [Candidatus Heimdallarchaeota archaeon]|nr:ABC transporter permease subunit [Candidatus Heimdallarchaeota archaeon]